MPVLRERLKLVEDRIQKAAARCGRQRSGITLMAVTKKFSADVVREAYELGLRDFGENYVQEFEAKKPRLTAMPDARFHLIGHLQSNKTRVAAELFHAVQTVDSAKLARRLSDACVVTSENDKTLEVMIEVKLSEEESKFGALPEALPELVEAIRACARLRLTGLMTMPPWNDDPEQTRPYFARLAALAKQHALPKLSMGMSHDFEAAIEEGATHIRVGRGLFGPRV
jgi:pyridoxal phosphate enzyme (YggS family)